MAVKTDLVANRSSLLLLQHRLTAAEGRDSVSATWHMHTANFKTLKWPMNFIFMLYRQQRTQVVPYCFTHLATRTVILVYTSRNIHTCRL